MSEKDEEQAAKVDQPEEESKGSHNQSLADAVAGVNDESGASQEKEASVLKALLVKNFTLKKKRRRATCCEILVPAIFIFMVISLKSLTAKEDVPPGWTDSGVDVCPYTGRNSTSPLLLVPCPAPYESFMLQTNSFTELVNFISGGDRRHPFARLALIHSGEQREIDAMNGFVDFVENEGVLASGPLNSFRKATFIIGNGQQKDFEDYVTSANYGDPFSTVTPEIAAAIFFEEMDFENAQFDYTLRLNSTPGTDFLQTEFTSVDPVDELQRDIELNDAETYMDEGFVTLQQLMDSFIISRSLQNYSAFPLAVDPNDEEVKQERLLFQPGVVRAQAFPISEFTVDTFFQLVEDLLPMIFVLVYLMPVSQIVSVIVLEKEVRAREMMRLMGVSDFKIISSWYVTYMIFFAILALIIMFSGGSMFPSTSEAAGGLSLLIFFLFWGFGLSIIAFGFVISTFFQKSFNGVVGGLMLYIILFFLFYWFANLESPPTVGLLIPQVAFAFSIKTLAVFEKQGIGASASLLSFEIEGFALSTGIFWMYFDFVLFTALGFYLNAVIPGEFGGRMPWYFPFTKTFWKNLLSFASSDEQHEQEHRQGLQMVDLSPIRGDHIEAPNQNMKNQLTSEAGIQIRGLSKTFKTPDGDKIAVNNLNLDVFEGQILVLLGHNGAGKTTTLQMLSGSLTPTSGEAFIYGNRLRTELKNVRNDLGFCPQHDVLYKELSVYDHLKFYGSVKGLSGQALEDAIKLSVEQVGLTEKIKVASKNLSGGMKRKLSLAISLIGDSRVIFVDEPTSGVDTFSRRSMWEVLQNCREGRVIILTTHFMDEADLLGDRIAIMAEGQLQCVGSSLFLKQLYGAGYQLTFVKEKDCDSDLVAEVVHKFVKGAQLTSDVGAELSFYLPLKESHTFSVLFAELDDRLEENDLKVTSYGVSVTTMEEVFLKAGQSDDLLEGAKDFGDRVEEDEVLEKKLAKVEERNKTQTKLDDFFHRRFVRQFTALFMKRMHYAKRDSYSFVCNTLVPVSIFGVGLAVLTFAPLFNDSPPIELSVNDWNKDFDVRGFLPIVELSSSDVLEFGNARVAQAGNFPEFVLEQPFAESTEVPSGIRTVFTQTYENGKSNNCLSPFSCADNFPNSTGNSILDMGEALLNPSELFQEQIDARIGASDFGAVILQTELIPSEKGACFLGEITIDAEAIAINVDARVVRCTDPESLCMMAEFSQAVGDLNIFTCMPAGCQSDFSVDSFLEIFGVAGIDPNQVQELADATPVFSCVGDLCNSPPGSITEFSVCRGGPSQQNELCVVSGLTELILQFDNVTELFNFTANPDAEACPDDSVAQNNTNNEVGVSAFLQSLECTSTEFPQEALDLVDSFGLAQEAFNTASIGGSFNESSLQCIDESFDCSLSLLPITQEANICLATSCVSEEEKLEILGRLFGTQANLSVTALGFLSEVECAASSDVCDLTVDLDTLEQLISSLQASGIINAILDSGVLDLLGGLGSTTSTSTDSNSASVFSRILTKRARFDRMIEAIGSSEIVRTLATFKEPMSEFNKMRIGQDSRRLQATNVTDVCEDNTECKTINSGDVCVEIDCEEQLTQAVTDVLGSTLGPLLLQFGSLDDIPSANCEDDTAVENLGCEIGSIVAISDISADDLEEFILNITGATPEVVDEIQKALTVVVVILATQLNGVENISLQEVLTALASVPASNLETLAVALSQLAGVNVTGSDLENIFNQAEQVPFILGVVIQNPAVISLALLNAVASETTQVTETCSDVDDTCVLVELDTNSQSVSFAAGCSSTALDSNSALNLVSDIGTTFGAKRIIFTCTSANCNSAARSPSNCDSDDLTPVDVNATSNELEENEAICFSGGIGYTYTMLINTSAVHAVPVIANQVHTALLRRSLVEYFDFSNRQAFPGSTITLTGSSDAFGLGEGGVKGNIDVQFSFGSEAKAPRITTRSHPMPFTASIQELIQTIIAFTSAIFCVLAFAFIPGPMISYIVMEKEEDVQIKHLQFVSGAGILPYWLANYAFDLMSYMIPFFVSLLLILIFDVDSFIQNGAFQAVAVVFLGYGLAIIPFSYLVGHFFQKHTTALIWIIIINCLTGLTLMIASFAMDAIPDTEDANEKLKWIYRLFPGFCLGDSLLQIAITSLFLGLLGGEGSFYDQDVAGANVTYLYLEAVVFFLMVVGIEYMKTQPDLLKKLFPKPDQSEANIMEGDEMDQDVKIEEERVVDEDKLVKEQNTNGNVDAESGVKEDVLRMIHLRKEYGKKVAVKDVTLGIPEGECFGYLGINGAGKTTTMKCLTGDVFPTSGTGYIKGYNIVSDQHRVRQHVGYCSQFSSILGLLTVREHLVLFCNIKEVEDVNDTVETLLRRLSLTPFANKLSKSLSGGNKRKLSVAIAMIGAPAVMLLDEPSTGMDVASRRFMWNVIEKMSTGAYDGKKTSVVLTTHSMEECEALCARVAIMVGGRLRCLGSVQHLKSRFGTGFTIEAKIEYILSEEIEQAMQSAGLAPHSSLKEEDLEAACTSLGDPDRFKSIIKNDSNEAYAVLRKLHVNGSVTAEFFVEWMLQQQSVDKLRNFLDERFTGLEIVETHDYRLTFRVAKDASTRLSVLFEALETHKEELRIAEYAVSQTTLEQIFNGFAAQQEEEKGRPRGLVVKDKEEKSEDSAKITL